MPADVLDPPADSGAVKLRNFPPAATPDLADIPASPMVVDGVTIPEEVRQAGLTLFKDTGAFIDWLRAPRPHFEGQSPLSLIAAGGGERVSTLLMQLIWGVLP